MKLRLAALLVLVGSPAWAQGEMLPADETAVFTAAGFVKQDDHWTACADDVSASYTPGAIEFVGDVNNDGQPEAVTSEGSAFCYGFIGTGYAIVSRQADGTWKMITQGIGLPRFLETKGTDGWPDLEVGGPGFCFPIQRWNGTEYAFNRSEYEGKRCTPQN